MRVLVTGGAGFIGHHLCRRLRDDGHAVISLDDYSTGSVQNHVTGVVYRRGSTRFVTTHVPEIVDIIFHLGEFSRVCCSFDHEREVHESNVLGTAAVLRLWQRMESTQLVYAGSSTRFSTDGSSSPYTASKKANADRVTGLGGIVTYFYNVYGPGERGDETGTLVEKFRQQHQEGSPLTVVAPGTQRRNFTHVEDIVEGIVLAASRGGPGDEFQIGAAESYSVMEVAEMFGGTVELLLPRRGDREDSLLDTSKIEALGWRQKYQLRDYVEKARSRTREHAQG